MRRNVALLMLAACLYVPAAYAEVVCSKERPEPQLFWKVAKLAGGTATEKRRVDGVVFGFGRVRLALKSQISAKGAPAEQQLWSKTLVLNPSGEMSTFSREVSLPRGARLELEAQNIGTFSGYCVSKEVQEKQRADLQKLEKEYAAENSGDVSVSGPGTWY